MSVPASVARASIIIYSTSSKPRSGGYLAVDHPFSRDVARAQPNSTAMKTMSQIAQAALVFGSLLLLAACETPPTVVTQTTTMTETTAVTRGDHLVAAPTTVVYPSEVRSVAYRY